MTFRPTPFTPYDASDWTASREIRHDVSDAVAQARAPQAGVPLQRPTETDAQYEARLAGFTNPEIEMISWTELGRPDLEDHALPGYDETDD